MIRRSMVGLRLLISYTSFPITFRNPLALYQVIKVPSWSVK